VKSATVEADMPTRNILENAGMRIKAGAEALDRRDFTEVDDAALDTYLEEQLRVENASQRRAPRLQEPRG
jgi:hypothetical protein